MTWQAVNSVQYFQGNNQSKLKTDTPKWSLAPTDSGCKLQNNRKDPVRNLTSITLKNTLVVLCKSCVQRQQILTNSQKEELRCVHMIAEMISFFPDKVGGNIEQVKGKREQHLCTNYLISHYYCLQCWKSPNTSISSHQIPSVYIGILPAVQKNPINAFAKLTGSKLQRPFWSDQWPSLRFN